MLDGEGATWSQGGHASSIIGFFLFVFQYVMGKQLLSRAIPFVFNIWIVRHLSAEEYALYSVKFHLFVTFILFLSREGFRKACLRSNTQSGDASREENDANILSVAWITVTIGLFLTFATCTFMLFYQRLRFSDPYALAILLNALACILELLAEPLYILCQKSLLLKQGFVIETIASFSKCGTMCLFIYFSPNMDKGLLFASSQAVYGASLFISYWFYFCLFKGTKLSDLLPFGPGDEKLCCMCVVFTGKSIGMFIIQEAEKLFLANFDTPYNQGVYGFVDKLGSLVVRLVFFPFEETCYTIFAKLAEGPSSQRHMRLEKALVGTLKFIVLIGFVVVAFGPSYSYLLIRLLFGKKWSDGDAPLILRYYCAYVFLLAINGTSEAFLNAVADKDQLGKSTYISFPLLALHLLVIYSLSHLFGTVGYVMANSINMIFRILYSARFIKLYFQNSFPFHKCVPSGRAFLILLISCSAVRVSETFLDSDKFQRTAAIHLFVGVAFFLIFSVVIYKDEKPYIGELVSKRKHSD